MDNQHVFSHKEVENFEKLGAKFSKCDSKLRDIEAEYPFNWMSKTTIFAITLPEYDDFDNWDVLFAEFEKWYYSIAISEYSNHVDQHLEKHTLEDIIKFRGAGSMHHRFNVAFDSFSLRIEKHGLKTSGTNRQKSDQFWNAIKNGTLTNKQAQSALRESLLPPSPEIKKLPQAIIGKYLTPAIRPCYINFRESLKNFSNITEMLELLFLAARSSASYFISDTTIDKNALSKKLENLLVLRGDKYSVSGGIAFNAFASSSLFPLLVFLFRKGLITIPTSDNADLVMCTNVWPSIVDHYTKSSYRHSDTFKKGRRSSVADDAAIITDGFNNPLTEYILHNMDNDSNKNDEESIKNHQITSVTTSITTKFNELTIEDSVIAVNTSSTDSACTYSVFDENTTNFELLFNRTNKVIALPKTLGSHDILKVLNNFKNWASKKQYKESDLIKSLNLSNIAASYSSLYDLIDKLSYHIENAIISNEPELTKSNREILDLNEKDTQINKKNFIRIGDLFFMYLWLDEYILLPCNTRALGFTAPFHDSVKGLKELIEDNKNKIINKYFTRRPNSINILERGLIRTITASTPITSIDDIHEGHLELIFYYGYSYLSTSMRSEINNGLRGITEFLTPIHKNKKINPNKLNRISIRKRLPTHEKDIWFAWQDAGLHGWYGWLQLLSKKSDIIKGKTARGHINKHFLNFLQKHSQFTNKPIPETPFGITPRMIVSETSDTPDYQSHVSSLDIKTKSTVFNAAKYIFDILQERYPDEWSNAGFVHPFPKRSPFSSPRKNTTHRRPIESLHLDAIKDVLLSPDKNGIPTFSWVKNEYCKIGENIPASRKKDVLSTDEGHVWWPGTAICLAFLLEVPVRGFQARWLDQGCLDDELFSLTSLSYTDNPLKVDISYPDGKLHKDKYKKFNGRSGVLQQRQRSFMDSGEDSIGASLFINTNKTSVEQGKFDQGYFIPWPKEEGTSLPYWLIEQMIEFNRNYDPTPKPISLAYEGEMHRAKTSRFIYSINEDTEKINQYPFVTPLFRDLTRDARYTSNMSNTVYDGDGNEIIPPLERTKLSKLLNAVAIEAEKRLLADGYPESLASMTDDEGNVIYDIHTLRVTGVSRLMALGVPIEVIRDVVGHAVTVMTYYYSVLDQLEIMKKLREGASIDIDHFSSLGDSDDSLGKIFFPNTHADQTAEIQYGGWVERNGGICPSGVCDEGGPPNLDNQGNTLSFTPVPGGSYRCGNCRLWMTGPKYIPQQVHYIDLLMNEIVEKHEDRMRLYESKLGIDAEIENMKRSSEKMPQSLLAKASGYEANITQITEKLSNLWMEWRNRYQMLETSIATLDNNKEDLDKGSLVLFTGQDPVKLNIQRHCGSKFGLKREIANSIIYQMPISHEVEGVLNSLERDMTKLQMFMASNDGVPISISQILDDDLRNRAIALHAQHLYLIMQNNDDNADQRIDKILTNLQGSLPNLEDKEYTALKKWNMTVSDSLKEMIQIPVHDQSAAAIPFNTNLITEDNNE